MEIVLPGPVAPDGMLAVLGRHRRLYRSIPPQQNSQCPLTWLVLGSEYWLCCELPSAGLCSGWGPPTPAIAGAEICLPNLIQDQPELVLMAGSIDQVPWSSFYCIRFPMVLTAPPVSCCPINKTTTLAIARMERCFYSST